MAKKLQLLGFVCLGIGLTATLLSLPYFSGLFVALAMGFIGMVCSGIYVYLDTKYEINTKKITPGIISMVLSSVPVLVIFASIIIRSFLTH